jgi:hypothetical protein
MNHNPSDDSANVHPSGRAVVAGAASPKENHESYQLNPSLQQALGCLDIKLEDELTRFRSQPEDRSPAVQAAPAHETSWERQSVDFESDAEIVTAEIVRPAMSSTIVDEDPLGERLRQRDPARFAQVETVPTNGFIIIDGLSTSTSNSRNAITTVNYAPISVHRAEHERLNLNFSSGGEIAPFQDEYLSSSQELLRQIQSGYPAADALDNRAQSAPTVVKPKHLTPLKIGSMAAACILAGGAAYTYFNPSILAPLTATKVVTPISTTTSALGQSIQSPNLAANEFTELNLSTLNNIKLPTAAPTTNVSTATTSTMNAAPTVATTTPAAIPFNGTSTQIAPAATITSQPRLADSLVRSLLPPNFHTLAKQSSYQAIPPNMRR